MNILIITIIFLILLYIPFTRTILLNIFSVIYYSVVDIFNYFKYKKYNDCPTGEMIAFTGHFGKGKTLSMIHYVKRYYKKYNNKRVYDKKTGEFVTQKIHILSNVNLDIPYEQFNDLGQIIWWAEHRVNYDLMNKTRTITLVVGDEFSVQMNSRNFKKNLDPLLLNSILTCRHHYISIFMSSQRFNHLDALLRSVTQKVYECDKLLRLETNRVYDAWEVENSSNPLNIKPLRKIVWFVRNRDYNSYDTLACVGNLTKCYENGDMISESEIIELQNLNPMGDDAAIKHSHRFRREKKRMR